MEYNSKSGRCDFAGIIDGVFPLIDSAFLKPLSKKSVELYTKFKSQ